MYTVHYDVVYSKGIGVTAIRYKLKNVQVQECSLDSESDEDDCFASRETHLPLENLTPLYMLVAAHPYCTGHRTTISTIKSYLLITVRIINFN